MFVPLFQEDVRALDKMTFSEWFEGKGGSRGSIERLWDPIAYALGFIDCDNISARCMLTIFQVSWPCGVFRRGKRRGRGGGGGGDTLLLSRESFGSP